MNIVKGICQYRCKSKKSFPQSCISKCLSPCSGCVSGLDEVNSRSVTAVLHRCKNLCEFHLVLLQAEGRLKRRLQHERSINIHRENTHEFNDQCSHESVSKQTTSKPRKEDNLNRLNYLKATRCKRLHILVLQLIKIACRLFYFWFAKSHFYTLARQTIMMIK